VSARKGGDDLGGGGVLRAWIECYGAPRALYTDWKNVYVREPNAGRAQAGRGAGDAVWADVPDAGDRDLGGEFTAGEGAGGEESRDASGPFSEEVARKEIRTHADANRYLAEEYCPQHNARYAQPAAAPEDDHLPSPGARKLEKIFRLERRGC